MAEKRISELTAKGATLGATDLLEISEPDGLGGYVSKRVTGSEVFAGVSTSNFANTNLTQTANRTYDANGYNITFTDIDSLTFNADAFTVKNITGGNNIIKLTTPATFGSNQIQFGRNGIDNNCGSIFSNDVALSIAYTSGINVSAFAGGFSIGSNLSSINASAVLEINSTTKGVLLPRMTATEASAVTGVDGLILYVTSTNGTFTSVGFWGYENSTWVKL